MLHKVLLILTFSLVASSAWAQNPTCPTRPLGDNSNACASTAFVQNNVGNIHGPGSSVIGNLAFWTNTLGTTLGATPTYHALNPGNAALYSVIAYPTGLSTINNVMQICQGTCIPASQQFGTNLHGVPQTIVGSVNIPAGDLTTLQAQAVAGYAITNTAERGTNTGPGAIGIFGHGATSVANANIFGGNIVSVNTNGDQNAIGFNLNYQATLELDFLAWQTSPGVDPTYTSGHAYGLVVVGSSNLAAKITNSSGIVIDRISVPTNVPWDYGISSYPGATVSMVVAGPATTGVSTRSQYIAARGTDGVGTNRDALFYSDIGGNAVLSPFLGTTGIVSLDNGNGTALLTASGSFGGGKVRIPAFTVAGVVTNDITTGQLNSVTTLPSGLTAPALIVTGSFTATGLVTNADLVNASTTVNSQVCTLGSTCTITAAASSIIVGSSTVTSGTTTRILFDNAGILGEYVISGTGNVAMTTNAIFTTPNLGTPSALVGTNVTGLPTTALTGTLQAAQEPAHTGDVANTAGSLALTIAANAVTLAKLATQATNTVLGNATSGTAVPTALAVGTCSTASSALIWTTNTGFGCNTTITASAVPASGLTGTTLASGVTASSLTSLGTITSLTATAIGSVTPGTGAFTTLTASTSITSPLLIGGSGTTQALTYKTTTGIGATGADHIFQVGNNGATVAARFYNSGAISFGGTSDGAAVGKVSVFGINAAITVNSTTDGTTNSAATQTINSTSTVNTAMIANEPGRTTTRWGITIGNWAEFVDFGTNGVVFGEFANAPVLFGTNALERGRFSAAGGFSVGTTTDAGAANILVSGHLLASGTAPTVSSCGISPSISGGDNFGTVTAGTGILASCVINFAKTWGSAPRCAVSSSTAIASLTVATSTTQLTIGGTSLTSDVIAWVCGSTASLEPANDNSLYAIQKVG